MHNASHTAMHYYELGRDATHYLDGNARGGPDANDLALRLTERIAKLHSAFNRLELADREFTNLIEAGRARGNRVAEGEAMAWQSLIRARMNRMAEATATPGAALQVAAETSNSRLRALPFPSPSMRQRSTRVPVNSGGCPPRRPSRIRSFTLA
jgi:hypothetical protein